MRILDHVIPWKVYYEHDKDTAKLEERKQNVSKIQMISKIIFFRVLYLMAMMLSCHFITEHNPGDDVLRFDMRLNSIGQSLNCFCLKGQSCEVLGAEKALNLAISRECIIPMNSGNVTTAISVWNFVLRPFTKWDAARFLHLALNPGMRDPFPDSFDTSEQTHAFFPLFPWIIRTIALFLSRILPMALLPPTYEALLVGSGVLFNNFICLPVSTLALYELTRKMVHVNNASEGSTSQQDRLAMTVCLVFGVWNPASVFFATNYSEPFFAMTTLLGHLCMVQRGKDVVERTSFVWWCIGITMWMLGSYTRSNGTIHSAWLLQDGLARICHNFYVDQRRISNSHGSTAFKIFSIVVSSIVGAILVALPVRYHDWQGFQRHCQEDIGMDRPSWCLKKSPTFWDLSFSFYGYVQEKHWNVGLFRYYQWKQIPNFALAAPILLLSIGGAMKWIHWSLVTEYGKGKVTWRLRTIVLDWPLHALSVSVDPVRNKSNGVVMQLLENPLLLGHYAILAILGLVGLVIAHIQISTRMICSSSPAIIWFLTYCMLHPKHGNFVWYYAVLYMLLGIILHVNFLPWT
ncbi:mannosyltransferase PIG-V [Nitzschia inconspicua]|uniref:GPI mannosyltransferase 2 n=1 Tax=Nitzschia inconspicua TaxID=303405 RepID=A0A9K3Q6K4_9STRA|nr:mannosyltransferase PIG-V [Nitzschia inconspicua]